MVGVVVLGAPAGTAAWLAQTHSRHAEEVVRRRAAHEKRFLEERAKTMAMPFLRGIGSRSDAGPTLNLLVPWWDRVATPLTLGKDEQAAYADDIVALIGRDLPQLRFDWMRALARFDHWRIDADERVQQQSGYIFEVLPDYETLVHYGKARLVDGVARGDEVAASAEVQQLARLLMSSELLISTMVATNLLAMERKLYEAESAKGRRLPEAWRPLAADDIEMIRRVARGGFEYMEIAALDLRVLDGNAPLDCVALHEGLASALAFRVVAAEAYADAYEAYERLASGGVCRFTAVRSRWTLPDEAFEPQRACGPPHEFATCLRYSLTHVPLVRGLAVRAFVETDVDSSGFTGFAVYEPKAVH